MNVAVMQPYFFPYIGYFQMIKAVDTFIFYDDVSFIKRGWINRNKILSNNKELLFTLPLKEASQNKLIKDVETAAFDKWKTKFLKTLHLSYFKAPFFEEVCGIIKLCLDSNDVRISSYVMNSVIQVSNYLKLNTVFEISSEKYAETKGLDKAHRLIEICKQNNTTRYINAIGGAELYDKSFLNNTE